jgi:hypothetical protein
MDAAGLESSVPQRGEVAMDDLGTETNVTDEAPEACQVRRIEVERDLRAPRHATREEEGIHGVGERVIRLRGGRCRT